MDSLLDAFNRLSQREKALLGVMAAAVFIFVVFLGVLLVSERLSEYEESLATKRAALETVMANKDAFLQRQAEKGDSDALVEGNDLNLTTFAAGHAKTAGFEFPKFYPVETEPHFLRKVRRGADAKPDLLELRQKADFKKLSLQQLTKFLDNVDAEAKRPVAVTKLHMKTQWSDREKINGFVVLSTWKKPESE